MIGPDFKTLLKTMKLRGMVMGQEVVVLIDCGGSHNFISVDLVAKLGIPSASTHNFGVPMETGLSVQGMGLCKGLCYNCRISG